MSDGFEHHRLERKSLRKVVGKSADWSGLARECVCFANAHGGTLLLGFEDKSELPPAGQTIPASLAEEVFKRVVQLTVNVAVSPPVVETAANGGEYLRLDVPVSSGVAATMDGRYYARVADECQPVPPDQLVRLVAEKGAYDWESRLTEVRVQQADPEKRARLLADLRASERVKAFVKGKSDRDLLQHYALSAEGHLTQLGVLWIGTRAQRDALSNAPLVQYFRYDDRGARIDKEVWDDHSLNPAELMAAVEALPVWREAIEIPAGVLRRAVPLYNVEVVRELVANALVHRAYTMRGDIRLDRYADRLVVSSPGPLPRGVTEQNILHTSVRRNERLARLFHDLGLMEREGSGYDRLYRIQLEAGKPVPQVRGTEDGVHVTVRGQDLDLDALRAVEQAAARASLTDHEVIALGLVAQKGPLRIGELARLLDLPDAPAAHDWLGTLPAQGLVVKQGRRSGTHYAVNPDLLRASGYRTRTTLRTIEDHRLRELILTDVGLYPESAFGEIHERVGPEIPLHRVQRALYALVEEGAVKVQGKLRWARYAPAIASG